MSLSQQSESNGIHHRKINNGRAGITGQNNYAVNYFLLNVNAHEISIGFILVELRLLIYP